MFGLFAQTAAGDVTASTNVVVIIVGMVITSLGALAASLFSWLSARDKLKFDASVVKMQSDLATLQSEVRDCTDERNEVRDKSERVERELREEIRELRDRLESRGNVWG
jgi:uncharacterized protein YlxW (UPF0749 family)